MKTWRWLWIIAAGLTVLIIGGLIWGFFQLDKEMKTRLESKEFLAPTTFWSSPEAYPTGNLWSDEDLRANFERNGYQMAASFDALPPKTYLISNCQHLPQKYDEGVHCFSFRIEETLHPELRKIRAQTLVLNPEGIIIEAWAEDRETQTWNPVPAALREPQRVAQFVEGEPLLQEWVPLGEIPTSCLNAVLAIEDPRFLEHAGVNWRALGRAALVNLTSGRFAQGGSTITQQMVKNFFLNADKTLQRKLREFAMALILESNLGKDQIFEIYLNIIYLGQSGPFQVRGYQAASQYYFQKKVTDLNLPECALLATILNSPGQYDPFRNPEAALKRRQLILEKMVEHQFISPADAEQAQTQALPVNSRPAIADSAPYFIEAVQRRLSEEGHNLEGTQVFTTMSPRRQELAQKTLVEHLKRLETTLPKVKALKEKQISLEGLVLNIDIASGRITTAVAGRGFRRSPFNRILDGNRQIGSLAKPFVYITAFDENPELSPLSLIMDEKKSYPLHRKSWTPENYDKKFHGEVTLNYALKNSLNASTAALGLQFDLDDIIKHMKAAGIRSNIPKVPSLTLGAMDLKPIEVAEAYLTIARMGNHIDPQFVDHLVYANGQVESFVRPDAEQKLSAEATGMVVGIMKEVNRSGTARAIAASGFPWPSAGKTGTTSDYRDAWYVGFTPWDLTLVWVGYDQPQSHGLTGGGGALPVWLTLMRNYSEHRPVQDFIFPESLRMEELVTPPDTQPSQVWLRKSEFSPRSPQY